MFGRLKLDIGTREQELHTARVTMHELSKAYGRIWRRRLTSPKALAGAFLGGVSVGLLRGREQAITPKPFGETGPRNRYSALLGAWNTVDHYLRMLAGTALLPFLVREMREALRPRPSETPP
jgi:hypothetical protein